jgi:hypothetical protein
VKPGSDRGKYIRECQNGTTGQQSLRVWGVTHKCGSTSMMQALPQPRMYTELRKGDHVRLIVRDPRDRLVSAWRWFSRNSSNGQFPSISESAPADHAFLTDNKTEFGPWVETALRHWNSHWAPQTDIHRRWREFHLIPIQDLHTLGWGHEKKTRSDNTWEQYYDGATLALVNEVYKEDLEMWEVIKDGINTGTNRVLQ